MKIKLFFIFFLIMVNASLYAKDEKIKFNSFGETIEFFKFKRISENLIVNEIENYKNINEDSISKINLQLSINEVDLLVQQLTSCWVSPAGAVLEKGMFVKISAKFKKNKTIHENSLRIVDTNMPEGDPMIESAMRTLLNPECSPLKLPEDKYNLWKNLTIIFDYNMMKGY